MYPDDFDVENDNCHPSHFFCSLFWEDPDISELYLRRQFRHLVLVTSTGKQKMAALSLYSARRGIDNQHFHFCYFKNWHYWPLVLADVLLPRGWSPSPLPTGWRISAPPWATLTVVLITLAWCHLLLEFKSSPRWLEMSRDEIIILWRHELWQKKNESIYGSHKYYIGVDYEDQIHTKPKLITEKTFYQKQ